MLRGPGRLALLVATTAALAACAPAYSTGALPPLVTSSADLEPGSAVLSNPLRAGYCPTSPANASTAAASTWRTCAAEESSSTSGRRGARRVEPRRRISPPSYGPAPLGVSFVGVDIKDDRPAALAFLRSHHVPYPSIYDEPGALLLRLAGLAPQSPPTTFLLDRRGRVAARFGGGVTKEQLLGPVRLVATETA